MIKVKNPNQMNIFDPWDFLSPKRRQLLDQSWSGLFREHILPTIPVERVFKFFDESFGRPSKELYSRLGAQILQQTFDLTDEETLQQYAFNIQWQLFAKHYRRIGFGQIHIRKNALERQKDHHPA